MRRIGTLEIVVFLGLLALILLLGIGGAAWLAGMLTLGQWRPIALLAAAVMLTYLCAFVVYRLALRRTPPRVR